MSTSASKPPWKDKLAQTYADILHRLKTAKNRQPPSWVRLEENYYYPQKESVRYVEGEVITSSERVNSLGDWVMGQDGGYYLLDPSFNREGKE